MMPPVDDRPQCPGDGCQGCDDCRGTTLGPADQRSGQVSISFGVDECGTYLVGGPYATQRCRRKPHPGDPWHEDQIVWYAGHDIPIGAHVAPPAADTECAVHWRPWCSVHQQHAERCGLMGDAGAGTSGMVNADGTPVPTTPAPATERSVWPAVIVPDNWRQQLWNAVERGYLAMYPGTNAVPVTTMVTLVVAQLLRSWPDGQVDTPQPGSGVVLAPARPALTDEQKAAVAAALESGRHLACDGEEFAALPACEQCQGTGKQFNWDDLPDCLDCDGTGKLRPPEPPMQSAPRTKLHGPSTNCWCGPFDGYPHQRGTGLYCRDRATGGES